MTGPLIRTQYHDVGRAIIRTGLLPLALLATPVAAGPGEPAGTTSDWQLTLLARHTLWEDPTLDTLNLGVTVRQGVATLNGPVPSAEVARQAVGLLKRLPGVRGVINETYVPPPDDPLTKAMPHPVTAQRLPQALELVAPPPKSGSPPATAPAPTTPPPAAAAPAATLLPPVAAPSGPMTVGEQIERLRQSDRRFRDVSAEVVNGRVTLRGWVDRPQDAWEFAEAVRKMPGVKGVVQGIAVR